MLKPMQHCTHYNHMRLCALSQCTCPALQGLGLWGVLASSHTIASDMRQVARNHVTLALQSLHRVTDETLIPVRALAQTIMV